MDTETSVKTISDGLIAFVDDSGNSDISEWYVLAGYLSDTEGWNHFEGQWQAVLDESPPLTILKGNRVFNPRDNEAWKFMTDAERSARLSRFIKVIGECTMRAFSVAVRRRDYMEVFHDHLYSEVRSPYYWLFIIYLKCVESAERHSGDMRRISGIFDRDDLHPAGALTFLQSQYHNMNFKGRLGYVGFSDDEICLPLQSADLLAWQVHHALRVGQPDTPLYKECLHAPPLKPFSHVLTRENLISYRDVMLSNAKDIGLRIVERRIGGTDRKPQTAWIVQRDDNPLDFGTQSAAS